MLGTLPKDLSQVATSQGYFPKCQLSKYVQFPKGQLTKSALATELGPPVCSSRGARSLAHPSSSARPPLQPAAPQRA